MSATPAEMTLFEPPAPARKRPLRTYSRRSVASDREESESPRKKRRVEEPATPKSPPEEESEQISQLPQLPPPKRGSILAFFRPLTPVSSIRTSTSPSVEPPAISPDVALPTSTPPSSPLPVLKPRSRRRLTTRPALDGEPKSSHPLEPRPGAVDNERAEELDNMSTIEERPSQAEEPTPPRSGDSPFGEGGQSILSQLFANALSTRTAEAKPDENKESRARKKRRKKELVQTTLSLSMNPGPGFTICKTCGLLYNHLNEKDRKDHAKWHAGRNRVNSKLD